MAEIIEKTIEEVVVVDRNPAIITGTKEGNNFIETITHKDPIVKTTIHNIEELQREIINIDNEILRLEEEKTPLQAIIDKFNQL